MDDTVTLQRRKPNRPGLFEVAAGQRGYFTTAQAADHGYARDLLAYHARTGTLRRVSRGLYRFRDFPSTPREEVVAAWLAAGASPAVVSHESALEWWGLGDIIPNAIHLTVPRRRRHLPRIPGVQFHTASRPLGLQDARMHEGARVTTPERTLLDLAEAGTPDDQLGYALSQAVQRGWVNVAQVRDKARQRGPRAKRVIDRLLQMYLEQASDDQAGRRQ
jgi:predicted transcriptional regulator of viral defense system